MHKNIATIGAGSAIHLQHNGHHWELVDDHGHPVGRMAKSFKPPPNLRCIGGRVTAIQVRRMQDVSEDFQHLVRSDHWEFVVPELVFVPEASE